MGLHLLLDLAAICIPQWLSPYSFSLTQLFPTHFNLDHNFVPHCHPLDLYLCPSYSHEYAIWNQIRHKLGEDHKGIMCIWLTPSLHVWTQRNIIATYIGANSLSVLLESCSYRETDLTYSFLPHLDILNSKVASVWENWYALLYTPTNKLNSNIPRSNESCLRSIVIRLYCLKDHILLAW